MSFGPQNFDRAISIDVPAVLVVLRKIYLYLCEMIMECLSKKIFSNYIPYTLNRGSARPTPIYLSIHHGNSKWTKSFSWHQPEK